MEQPLKGKTIAIPESRQLDILANMVEKRGGRVLRCPLVSIFDSPDPEPINRWLTEFINEPFDLFIIFTGEGLRRLLGFSAKVDSKQPFIEALTRVHKLTRGPKPGNALREIGLKTDQLALAPTTDGVIKSLDTMDLTDKRIAVQLYGDNPNEALMAYLKSRAPCDIATVAPYIYASNADIAKVKDLISKILHQEIDVITFTSQPQIKRLLSVAKEERLEQALISGLNKISVAAVGPVVGSALQSLSINVEITPDSSFFMKPMVRKMVEVIGN